MWWFVCAAAAFAVGYWLLVRPYKHWIKMGVKQGNPTFIFGDFWGTTVRTLAFSEMLEMIYKMFPNARYSGFYQFMLPTLLIKDPELIKQIAVKDFDHFTNHRTFISEENDPLWGKNLFALNDQNWRDMKATLRPVFTSSKMKYMFSLMSQSGQQFVNFFLEKNEEIVTIEMKDSLSRFSNDVIANTAFGIECDSLGDRTNEFFVMGKELTDLSGFWTNMKILGYLLLPKLYKIRVVKIQIFSQKVVDFFTRLIKSNIESREQLKVVRPDMINLLLEARKSGLKYEDPQSDPDTGFATVEESDIGKNRKSQDRKITDEDITSQAMIFFFAGFDAVSSLMCFMSYELAINPDIQQKLIQEVDETSEACNGNITYEALLDMKYMDMVVSESLRKWPNTIATDRVCTKPYTIQPNYPDEVPVHLKVKDPLWIPIFAIHRDPQYYSNPDRFDPERFNEENKGNIKPYTYLSFGVGPRNCIGSKFALLETKVLFFYVLSHFEIILVERTQTPLKIKKGQFTLTAEGGFWLALERRIKV